MKQTIKTSCLLCKEKENVVYCTAQDNQNNVNTFTIVKCSRCHFLYLNPVPAKKKLSTYYPSYYWVGEKQKFIEKIFPFFFSASQEKTRYVKKYKAYGSLLDIGCAEGFFLKYMKKQGWNVIGIDFSEKAVAFGKEHLGLELYAGEITGIENKLKKNFDVITLWATLEHVYDPLETLRAAHRLLKEDGVLIFAVPNIESIQAKVFRRYWLHLDVPRHLCFFTPKTVKMLCDKADFVIKDVSYQSVEHNPGGWVYSFLYYIREKKNKKNKHKEESKEVSEAEESDAFSKIIREKPYKKERMSAARIFFYWLVDNIIIPLIVPLTYVEGFLKKGGTITVIAKKK